MKLRSSWVLTSAHYPAKCQLFSSFVRVRLSDSRSAGLLYAQTSCTWAAKIAQVCEVGMNDDAHWDRMLGEELVYVLT